MTGKALTPPVPWAGANDPEKRRLFVKLANRALSRLSDSDVAAVVIQRMRKMPDPEHQLAAALRTFMAANPFANPTGLASMVINFPGDGGRPSVGWQEWVPTKNQWEDIHRNERDKQRISQCQSEAPSKLLPHS